MEIIISVKDCQVVEVNKNVFIFLEQIDLEKEREELKKVVVVRKRDKKKQKKKKKLQVEKEVEINVKNMVEKENSDDSSEFERKILVENGGQSFLNFKYWQFKVNFGRMFFLVIQFVFKGFG